MKLGCGLLIVIIIGILLVVLACSIALTVFLFLIKTWYIWLGIILLGFLYFKLK